MIDKILNTEISRKDFIKKVGIGLFVLLAAPSAIQFLFKEDSNIKIIGNNIYHKNKLIIEVTE